MLESLTMVVMALLALVTLVCAMQFFSALTVVWAGAGGANFVLGVAVLRAMEE